jgi:peptidoglycan/LPS O-acetylase OafA/YrhL
MISQRPSLQYIPELDGFRAVAVLAVILFHMKIPGFALGWLGVFLFFVISGFLITGILLDSKKNSSHYFRNFYIRRILRIFPLYYLSILATIAIGLYFKDKFELQDTGYYLLYAQNYLLGETTENRKIG